MIRLPHLSWPQRIAIGLAGFVIALAGGLTFPGTAGAWHGIVHVSDRVCQPNSGGNGSVSIVWLTIDNPEAYRAQFGTSDDVQGYIDAGATSNKIAERTNGQTISITLWWYDAAGNVLDRWSTSITIPKISDEGCTPATTIPTPPTSTPGEPPVSPTTIAPTPTLPVATTIVTTTTSEPTPTPVITTAAPPKQHTVTPSTPAKLPPTGAGEIVAICVIVGLVLCLVGWLAARVDRERRRQRCS